MKFKIGDLIVKKDRQWDKLWKHQILEIIHRNNKEVNYKAVDYKGQTVQGDTLYVDEEYVLVEGPNEILKDNL